MTKPRHCGRLTVAPIHPGADRREVEGVARLLSGAHAGAPSPSAHCREVAVVISRPTAGGGAYQQVGLAPFLIDAS